MSDPEIRPNHAGIGIFDGDRFVSTDSFRCTRITQTQTQTEFPDVSNFFEKNAKYVELDPTELIVVCNLAVDISKNHKEFMPYVSLAGRDTIASEGEQAKAIPMSYALLHGLPARFSAKYILDFLKAVSKELKSGYKLEWHQLSPLSPLHFRMVTGMGTIEHIIMPLK